MKLSEDEYRFEREEHAGFCTACDSIADYGVEPDAREYRRPDCEGLTVCGLEEALLSGLIEIAAGGDGND